MSSTKIKRFYPIIALCIFYILYYLSIHFYIYPRTNLAAIKLNTKQDYLTQIPNEIDYLVLGDSTALYNINPKLLSNNSYSAANVASTLFLTERIYNQLKNLQIKRGLIITQTFIKDHYDTDIWKIHIPAGKMNLEEIYTQLCSQNGDACEFKYKILLALKYSLTKMHLDKYSMQEFAHFLNNFNQNEISGYSVWFSKNIESHNGHFSQSAKIKLSKREFFESYERNFKNGLEFPPASEFKSLNSLLFYASIRQIPLYFVITPFDNSMVEINYLIYRNDLKNLINKYKSKNVIVIDGNTLETNLEHSDFVDFNHLNNIGADKFSAQLSLTLNASEKQH